jgi:hypothetical protein
MMSLNRPDALLLGHVVVEAHEGLLPHGPAVLLLELYPALDVVDVRRAWDSWVLNPNRVTPLESRTNL